MAAVKYLVINILQNTFFCVQQLKETHTGLKHLRVSKWWPFSFLGELHLWHFQSKFENVETNNLLIVNSSDDKNCIYEHFI